MYMCQWTGSSLFQLMDCRMFGIKILNHCRLVTPYSDIDLVNIDSGSGLSPDGTKPVREPMLAFDWVLWPLRKDNVTVSASDINS